MEQITSRENPRIKQLARLLRQRSCRRETGLFVCEGARLCADAFHAGATIREFYVTQTALQRYPQVKALADSAGQAWMISDGVAEKLGDTKTPQGVFAVCEILDNRESVVTIKNGGKYVLLSSLQNPGNLGTILRSGEALGVTGLFLSHDCPDLYSPKVIRGSMGALFRLPVALCADLGATVSNLMSQGVEVFAAALSPEAQSPQALSSTETAGVLIGNEGNGLGRDLLQLCTHKVMIPMPGEAQSLNAGVAASILMYEMNRRILEVRK